MFIYWDGFEIDGSDTSFYIVLPENVQVSEFVECFLSIPIFSKTIQPTFSYYQDSKKYDPDWEELKEKLLVGNYSSASIVVNCLHLEELSEKLRTEIYAISERRKPHEAAFGKVDNPCIAPSPVEKRLELNIYGPRVEHCLPNKESGFDGYVHNIDLLRSVNQNNSGFSIDIYVGFYFEYAIFIIDYLRSHFPGIGVGGGLDCAGGWTCGCTYADSIYTYEKVTLPVKYSIKNTLKRLTEYNIVRSYEHYYYKGSWKHEYTRGFILTNYIPVESRKEKLQISFGEYLDLVEIALALQTGSFTETCDIAIQIMLPHPNEYSENPEAVEILRAALPQIKGINDNDSYYTGYFYFTTVNENIVCEFRVYYMMKKYLLTLLELVESGMIDFIKSVTYKRRHA